MNTIQLHIDNTTAFVPESAVAGRVQAAEEANRRLHEGTGAGADFLGWLNWPSRFPHSLLDDIESTANEFRNSCDAVVVAGIGGSYLGARAVIDALSNSFDWLQSERHHPVMLYAGHNISEDYLAELSDYLKNKTFGIINISKSGTTTETALAFRLLKTQLEHQIGKKEARKRIVAITDPQKGALRTLAGQEGYKTFDIPANIGGRYSVLTPVGLLPIAVTGIDIRQLIAGAKDMEEACRPGKPFSQNPAALYAVVRNELYRLGKKIEILVNYHPKLHYIGEWWKQLYGESEGKEHKGIFPAAVDFTTDLHSMGQWIQEGERSIVETVISSQQPTHQVVIPSEEGNLDGLNYLAGKRVDEVNKMSELGTSIAHVDGGVPNIRIDLPRFNEYYLGQLLYFFEKACGISGYLLGINPFDQPGVEAYKKNMFALLEKPGYEAETAALKKRISHV
jgi:glucose-6-phosphate isomerase